MIINEHTWIIYEHIWTYMIIYDHIPSNYGSEHICLYMRPYMDIYDQICPYMIIYKPIYQGWQNFFWSRSTKNILHLWALRIDFHNFFFYFWITIIIKKHIERVVLKINSNMIDFEIVWDRLFGRPCTILYTWRGSRTYLWGHLE